MLLFVSGNKKTEDLFDFNRFLNSKNSDSFSFILNHLEFKVNLVNGNISLNDKVLDLGIDQKLLDKCKESGFRWINFKRHKISYVVNGRATEEILHGIGWQSTVNGVNIQRILLIDKDGNFKVIKKGDINGMGFNKK